MELLFGIDVQKKFSLSYAWDKEKNCYMHKDSKCLTYRQNCEQKANIAVIKSTLKIPPIHNGVIPIKIKGHVIKGHTTYFISDQYSEKGRTLIYTSLIESITSKEKHMSTYSFQTTPTNILPSTKENMSDIWNHL